MMKCLNISVLVLFASFSMVENCLAHKITLFGYVDQGMVKTEAKFSGGRAARHCQMSMANPSHVVVVGRTNDQGMLDFPVPEEKEGFELIVDCGDGHRGTWRIEADELSGGAPLAYTQGSHTVHAAPENVLLQDSVTLRMILREELATELEPIKRQLAKLKQNTVSLADIMGGLGYFLGLAGLVSYMRFRRAEK